jgi:hypothetical protein
VKALVRACAALFALALVALGAAAGFLALGLRSYERLTFEQPVAELEFAARGPQQYEATLTRLPSGERESFVLAGDDWQLDARVLKWRGYANLLGLDARYRLERFSGRYRRIEQERYGPRSVFELGESSPIDLWALAEAYPRWLPFVDAVYGNAIYLPMVQGARYQVTLSQSGLVGRPLNDAARASTRFQ